MDVSKARKILNMIDDETYEVKEEDSSSLVDNIRSLALTEAKEEDRTLVVDRDDRSRIHSKEEGSAFIYESPLCGTELEGDADECTGCGAVFEE